MGEEDDGVSSVREIVIPATAPEDAEEEQKVSYAKLDETRSLEISYRDIDGREIVFRIGNESGPVIGTLRPNKRRDEKSSYSFYYPDGSEALVSVPNGNIIIGSTRNSGAMFGVAGHEVAEEQFIIQIENNANVTLWGKLTKLATYVSEPQKIAEEPNESIMQVPAAEDGEIMGTSCGRDFHGFTYRKLGAAKLGKNVPFAVNEDSVGANKDKGVFVLADGVGSSSAAEIAAHRAVKSLITSPKINLQAATTDVTRDNLFLSKFGGFSRAEMDTCYVAAKLMDGTVDIAYIGDPQIFILGKVNGEPGVLFRNVRHSCTHEKEDKVWRVVDNACRRIDQIGAYMRQLQARMDATRDIGDKVGDLKVEYDRAEDQLEVEKKNLKTHLEGARAMRRHVFTDENEVMQSNRITNSVVGGNVQCLSLDLPDDAVIVMIDDGVAAITDEELIEQVYGKSPQEATENLKELTAVRNKSKALDKSGAPIKNMFNGESKAGYLVDFHDGKDPAYVDSPRDNTSCIIIGPKKVPIKDRLLKVVESAEMTDTGEAEVA
ncbi:hypothetical protein ACFL2V_18370 [Pseudomonadota bacterium]